MSVILDQYGNPATWGGLAEAVRATPRFSGANNGDGERPPVPIQLKDVQKLIPPVDRKMLVAVSRYMIERWGPMRAIGRQIPMYSVGSAYKPTMHTDDSETKKAAEKVMREQFWPIGDLRGSAQGMTSLAYDMVHCLIRDGEFFILLSEYSTGFPAVQFIPSHRIGNPTDMGPKLTKVTSGPYKGAMIEDGIITNEAGTTIAFRFLDNPEVPESYKDISARSMIHCFDSDYPEAKRGYPAMAHGLNDGRDSMQSHDWERMNMLIRSSIFAIENNATGIAEGDHPGGHFDGPAAITENQAGTSVNYLKGPARTITYQAGSGQKLELLKHDNPGEIYEAFNDRCIRSICAGVPWPFSFVWTSTRQGTAERREIEQARRTIVDIQATIDTVCRRITGYAYKKFVKLGMIPDSADWWRWSFSKPAVLSIDPGRDTKATLDLHARGLISDDEMLSNLGWEGSAEEYWASKFNAAAIKEKAFQQAQSEHQVILDPRVKGMWTPNDPGVVETTTTPTK